MIAFLGPERLWPYDLDLYYRVAMQYPRMCSAIQDFWPCQPCLHLRSHGLAALSAFSPPSFLLPLHCLCRNPLYSIGTKQDVIAYGFVTCVGDFVEGFRT